MDFFVNLSNRFSISGRNIHYVFRGLPSTRSATDERLADFDLFAGSFHASLALAYYMGFSQVYLVGFDAWTIQPARSIRWYELGEGAVMEPTNLALEFLGVLREAMDIYALTAGGCSQNVTAVDYQAHTGTAPRFRENHELLDDRYLQLMNGCGIYNIYPTG
jgi:hypothetical protein